MAHRQHASDDTETQRLGALVRESPTNSWIRYGSVRAPGHTCATVFTPKSLAMVSPDGANRYDLWMIGPRPLLANGESPGQALH